MCVVLQRKGSVWGRMSAGVQSPGDQQNPSTLTPVGRGTMGAGGAEKLGKHPPNLSISPQP